MRLALGTVASFLLAAAQQVVVSNGHPSAEEDHPEQQLVFNRLARQRAMSDIKRKMAAAHEAVIRDRSLEAGAGDGMSPQLRGAIRSGNLEQTLSEMMNDPRTLLMSNTAFPECVGLVVEDCIATIQQEITNDPEAAGLFPNGVTFDVRRKRQPTDDNYNFVVIKAHEDGTVKGRNGGGEVDYPFPWKFFNDATQQVEEATIGPWDCNMLSPLTTSQCCSMIKSSVPGVDVNGREIECFIEYPEPPDSSRIIIVWDPTTNSIVEDAIPHTPTIEETV